MRILTGIRINEQMHIGNYVSALKQVVDLQRVYNRVDGPEVSTYTDKDVSKGVEIFLFIPDLHSFTTPVDHERLYRQSVETIKAFVAAGLDLGDPNLRIYRQSRIPAHSELTVILNNFVGFGELSRMTQFSEKSKGGDFVSVGLFDYPVLMAADILLYGADFVPVGEDQTQHISLVRDIAQRFNNKFSKELNEQHIFKLPKEYSVGNQTSEDRGTVRIKIRDLQNPKAKMSKSSHSAKGTIFLSDDPIEAYSKVMKSQTDSEGVVRYDELNKPGISNLIQIYCYINGKFETDTIFNVAKEFETLTYAELKAKVAEGVKDFLESFQEKLNAISEEEIMEKVERDERDVELIANETLLKVQKAVGLRE